MILHAKVNDLVTFKEVPDQHRPASFTENSHYLIAQRIFDILNMTDKMAKFRHGVYLLNGTFSKPNEPNLVYINNA